MQKRKRMLPIGLMRRRPAIRKMRSMEMQANTRVLGYRFSGRPVFAPDALVTANGIDTATNAISTDQVSTAARFLRLLRPTSSVNCNSYYLKHVAEAWGRQNGGAPYITNGALIIAATALSILVKPCRNSMNADVYVSFRDAERLAKQVRETACS